jgi:hypothetical protein
MMELDMPQPVSRCVRVSGAIRFAPLSGTLLFLLETQCCTLAGSGSQDRRALFVRAQPMHLHGYRRRAFETLQVAAATGWALGPRGRSTQSVESRLVSRETGEKEAGGASISAGERPPWSAPGPAGVAMRPSSVPPIPDEAFPPSP